MHNEKIKDSINAALSHLKNSIGILAKNTDEKNVLNTLWHASSETEYALFLFSLMLSKKSETAPWKQSLQTKQMVEAGPVLTSAQNLLQEAKNNIEAGKSEKAYEKAWTARHMLLKAQELLEKKQKSASAQSTPTH